MAQVVVVGDLMTDTVARAESALVTGSETPSTVSMQGGGSGANIAAWLAVAAGIDTAFVGRRGTDVTGRTRDIELVGYGVDAHLVMDPDRLTGSRVVLVTHEGNLMLLSDPAANAALSPDDLPRDLFSAGAHLHLSGHTLLRAGSRPAGQAALELARRQHMSVSVDTVSPAPLEQADRGAFLEWTSPAGLCLTAPAEARVLTGRDDLHEAARSLTTHYAEVVVRVDAEDALWLGDGETEPVHVHSQQVGDVVDASRAGDAFCAGFLPPWLAGESPAAALSSACRVAADALCHAGGRPVT